MIKNFRHKKFLGQHFLTDYNIAQKIVQVLGYHDDKKIIEIGPGEGILTQHLLSKCNKKNVFLIEIDPQCVSHLREKYHQILDEKSIIQEDFLHFSLSSIMNKKNEKVKIIGNFPYYITSSLFFKILAEKQHVDEVVCMIQKEVAERIVSSPNNKQYGILSVLLGTFYHIKLLFSVPPNVFFPQPRVYSAVLYLKRNNRRDLPCSDSFYVNLVKKSFLQRRKMLRNTLKEWLNNEDKNHSIFNQRPEQLSIPTFIRLATYLYQKNNTTYNGNISHKK